MNALTTLAPGGAPSVFQSAGSLPDMNAAAAANMLPSFSVISIKGKNWRIKYRGETDLVTDDKGLPMQVLPVVIVGISASISKIWYEKGWTEDANAPPDCFSTNGQTPDPASPKKQCATCAACPKNTFGSRITENGKRGKACQDARRIAVVPRGDLDNEGYGGAMLLRLPAMSLPNLDAYCKTISRFGAQPYMVATSMRFNYDVSHPEVIFEPQGWLTNDEATRVLEWISDPQVERILSTEVIEAQADPEQGDAAAQALAGGPPAAFTQPAPAAAPAPVQQAAPQPAPTPAAAAPTPAKKRGFGSAPAAAPAAQATTTVVQEQPAPAQTTVIAQAPTDMEAAIDDLLS